MGSRKGGGGGNGIECKGNEGREGGKGMTGDGRLDDENGRWGEKWEKWTDRHRGKTGEGSEKVCVKAREE